jgi:branched-chain amino acid transport system ATP-binding protein
MPTLELKGLTVDYGQVRAVRGIDLAVESREIFVLLGANGAGKSSTLRAVTGLIKSRGTVTWDGHDISAKPAHRIAQLGLVLVPEGRRIFSPLTVEENLKLGAYSVKGKSQREGLDRTYSMFPILGERRHGPAGLLSGGEQQMLAFGRALMADPEMILMDEPSMGLAPALVDVVMNKAAEIAASGIGVLMVEQNAAVALRIAQRAAVLDRGQITLRGSAEELQHHEEVLRAFLGAKARRTPAAG